MLTFIRIEHYSSFITAGADYVYLKPFVVHIFPLPLIYITMLHPDMMQIVSEKQKKKKKDKRVKKSSFLIIVEQFVFKRDFIIQSFH